MLCHELFFSTISFYYLPALNSLQGGENWLVLDILGYRAFNGTSLPMTWNVKLLFLILDWELATAFRESCFSLSPTLCSSVLNKGLTLPLSCYIINIYTGLREWEKGEVKNIRQQGRTESQRECGPKRAQASMWMKHWDDKEASFKDKPEIVLGQREIREQARAPDERQPESYATLSTHEWATEMERQRNPRTGRAPHPRPLTRRFCAWLAFSSSSFLQILVIPDLSSVAQLRDLFKVSTPNPGGWTTALPVWSGPPGKSLQLAQMAVQVPLWLSSSFKCQFLRSISFPSLIINSLHIVGFNKCSMSEKLQYFKFSNKCFPNWIHKYTI